MDIINGLPDDVLVKILSFVPTKVAVSTSVLSKRWEFLWMWLPRLEFTSSDPELRDFIYKNLPLHRAAVIESLRLHSYNQKFKAEDIIRWLEIAVSRHPRELDISYYPDYENIILSNLYTCKSLVTLKLKWLALKDVPSMVCLPSLKTLQLDLVKFVDDGNLQELLSICPVLEDLSVEIDDDKKEYTIIVPSLQRLSLFISKNWVLDKNVIIGTPSLNYLKLRDWNDSYHYSLIENMPKLREAYVHVSSFHLKGVIESITSVKRLTIFPADMNGDDFIFDQLEHLNLCVCGEDPWNLLGHLLKNSPKLRVLDITIVDYNWWENRMVGWNQQPSPVPECLLSSLQIFNWSGYFGRPEFRDIAVYVLKNARHLKKATILADTYKRYLPNLRMIKELALSPRSSSTCQLVFVEGCVLNYT